MENSFTNYMLQKLDCQVVFKKKQVHQSAPTEVLALLEEHDSQVQ
jgi:hypothetical protein